MFNKIKRKPKPLPLEVRQAMADPDFQKKVRDLMVALQQTNWIEDEESSSENRKINLIMKNRSEDNI